MKASIFSFLSLGVLFFALCGFQASTQDAAGKMGQITVKVSFKGIIEGYDHACKTQLFVDGKMLGESEVSKESQGNTFTTKVEKGVHAVRVVNLAEYEGKWEEHNVANNYTVDVTYEDPLKVKKKHTITLVADIGSESVKTTVK